MSCVSPVNIYVSEVCYAALPLHITPLLLLNTAIASMTAVLVIYVIIMTVITATQGLRLSVFTLLSPLLLQFVFWHGVVALAATAVSAASSVRNCDCCCHCS